MQRSLWLAMALPLVAVAPGARLGSPAPVSPSTVARPPLRVCSDPNNLPFSNAKGEGFENRIAELIARDWKTTVEYTWWAQRRGYIRNSLKAKRCDVMIGVPSDLGSVLTTHPYYKSTYVFVTRRDAPRITSFDDPALHTLRVGVQMIGDDFANSPPTNALTRRGIIKNVRGYTVIGDYREPNPPSRIVRAVSAGEIDVGIVWGPLAGYFAKRSAVPLQVAPVSPAVDARGVPFVFEIAMGVRRGDTAFRDSLNVVLERRRPEIDAILTRYGVPLVK